MSLSDRQRVELAIIPNMLLAVVVDGANTEDPETQEVEKLLAIASLEPIADLAIKDQRKLMRRVVRLHDEVMAPYREPGATVAKSGLIAFYLLQAVMEAEYLIMHEGSEIQKALGKVLPALEPAANMPDLDHSAQKAARKVMADLHGRGFFRGVMLT